MSFADLKNKSGSRLAALGDKIKGLKEGGSYEKDERYWKCETDKAGNGNAIIRFLPGAEGEDDTAFVRIYKHAFKGPTGKWYMENSLTTIGKKDPVAEVNKVLWDSNIKANRDLVSNHRRRREKFVSNILVIKDPTNPENEGKVFLFEYPKVIMKMIQDMIAPEPDESDELDEDEDKKTKAPVDVFDFWKGANFKLRIRKVDGFTNYDKSSFGDPAPLFSDDEQIEETYHKLHKLSELLTPANFKTYEELKAKLDGVLADGDEETVEGSDKKASTKSTTKPVVQTRKRPARDEDEDEVETKAAASTSDDEDDDVDVGDDDSEDLLTDLDRIADEG